MKKYFAIVLTLLIITISADAKIKLPSLFTDNMVLQQQSEVSIYGKATPGSLINVQVSWNKDKLTCKTDANGKWEVKTKTPKASYTAHTIVIGDVKEKITLKNVFIGEVWLASGQSNMEMPLEGFPGCCTKNGSHDAMMASVVSPYVRMFNVKKEQNMQKQEYCEGTWNEARFPETMKFSATAYYFASALSNALGIPVGIVNSSYGGAHVESWTSKEICETYSDIPTDSASVYSFGTYDFDRPLLMYNAMFWPVHNYTYKGIIWYQGCSNIGHADVYAERLGKMVEDWRKQIGCGEIPFYQVEIAPYTYGGEGLQGAQIREAQMEATKVIPRCGIISTNDLVEPHEVYNIHPGNKREVGDRLAFLALNDTYGFNNIICSGPRYKEGSLRLVDATDADGKVTGTAAVVGFESPMGIWVKGELQGFEIAGEDKVFHPAKAEFRWQTNEVYLTSDEVAVPVAVRYCYRDWQIGTLKGANDLPCYPFRTDKW